MADLLNIINKILASGTIGSQIFILLVIIYALLPYKNNKVSDFFSKNGIMFAFIIALVAQVGSLFYSNYAGFSPCSLCWFQRIFMYPEVILLGMALFKKEDYIVDYSLALSIVGWIVSAYHNYIYFTGLAFYGLHIRRIMHKRLCIRIWLCNNFHDGAYSVFIDNFIINF